MDSQQGTIDQFRWTQDDHDHWRDMNALGIVDQHQNPSLSWRCKRSEKVRRDGAINKRIHNKTAIARAKSSATQVVKRAALADMSNQNRGSTGAFRPSGGGRVGVPRTLSTHSLSSQDALPMLHPCFAPH